MRAAVSCPAYKSIFYYFMHRLIIICIYFLFSVNGMAIRVSGQGSYRDSVQSFRDHYISTHEVVTGKDRALLQFFPIDPGFRVTARFEKLEDAPWFNMETSGAVKKIFRVYGFLHFSLHDTLCKLSVYQSKQLMGSSEYADYLFLPFTDKTSGESTYDNGRYIDLTIPELEAVTYLLDFNKAYNPYCAYISNKYNCPVPPKENDLPVAVRAGEKTFGKFD